MDWNKLKDNRCPKCWAPLRDDRLSFMHECGRDGCDFKISNEKFDKIVSDLYKPKTKRCGTFDQNLSDLNNL